MSIAVLIGVHDGLVLAADSASTLMISTAPDVAGVANVYDNANKIFNLYKGKPIGCIAYGAGSIGSSSVATLIKDLRVRLRDPDSAKALGFDPEKFTMEQVAKIVADFLGKECSQQNPAAQINLNIGLLVGGYSSEASLGERWGIEIQAGKAKDPQLLQSPDEAGISWGGQGEVIHRIVLGFSPGLFEVLASVAGPTPSSPPPTAGQLQQQLNPLLLGRLQVGLAFAPMPIQDAIELGRFLVHATVMFSRFSPGPQVVGGPIEIATITKHEGFKWISRKHYYDQSLNREPIHVIVDNRPD
jgi:hypothetical protein